MIDFFLIFSLKTPFLKSIYNFIYLIDFKDCYWSN